jgi:uncharacterized protein YciW
MENKPMTQSNHPGLHGLEGSAGIEAAVAMRPKTFDALDAVFESYFHAPEDAAALPNIDRLFCAWKAASLIPHEGLAATYSAELKPTLNDTRKQAMEHHVTRLVREPAAMTQTDLAPLTASGLTLRQIVELSQIVAFVTYQARVLHGLRMWQKESL